ncbi:hypothetical protein SEA_REDWATTLEHOG_137 [Gordonia phage RedWattleHog]|uniref:Uncharacterized protein n=1 Tax=Gordonia phage Stormageddon TaxID=2656541 RepID=A0A649VSL6_9CAUD|nr:hypothetical protein KHQ86_gp165 [Gordonia phage Stormageddon]QGJ94995.1 hypothetical protein SEA_STORMAGEDDON_135 [Gordonia phage Stormageddon]QLF83640.1 hypothetical protein SEA_REDWATTLEHOG_137 [Gordonia phage RedWattleHog]
MTATITEVSPQTVATARRALALIASEQRLIGYAEFGDLLTALGVEGVPPREHYSLRSRYLGHVLGAVGLENGRRGEPLLTAIVRHVVNGKLAEVNPKGYAWPVEQVYGLELSSNSAVAHSHREAERCHAHQWVL